MDLLLFFGYFFIFICLFLCRLYFLFYLSFISISMILSALYHRFVSRIFRNYSLGLLLVICNIIVSFLFMSISFFLRTSWNHLIWISCIFSLSSSLMLLIIRFLLVSFSFLRMLVLNLTALVWWKSPLSAHMVRISNLLQHWWPRISILSTTYRPSYRVGQERYITPQIQYI